MKRGKKLLLLALIMLLMAGGAFAVRELWPEEESAAEEEETVIFSVDADSVTKLIWTYEGETITLVDAGEGWMYQDDRDFPLKQSTLDTMLSSLSQVKAVRTIHDAEDLSQYGLEEPVCTITVTAGKTSEITIGDETGLGGQRYLSLGDGNVYLVDTSLLTSFSCGLYDLVQKESIPSMTDIKSFTIESSTNSLRLEHMKDSGLAYSSHYTWFAQSEEGYTTLDTENTADFVEQISYLKWGDCVDYKATPSALKEYGLDEPAVTVTVTYTETAQVETNETDGDGNAVYAEQETERDFVLEIGGYTGSRCYARIAGSRMVYLISADICDSLLYTTAADLLPDDILILDWDTVTGFDIILDGSTYSFTKEERENTDEDGDTSYETCFTMDGEEADIGSVLDKLEALNATGSGEGLSPSRGAEISFIFHRQADSFKEVELTFYSYDSSACLVSLNGETRLFVSRDSVVSIVEAVNSLVLG